MDLIQGAVKGLSRAEGPAAPQGGRAPGGAQGAMARERGGRGIERPSTQDFGGSQGGRFNRGNKLKGKSGKETSGTKAK